MATQPSNQKTGVVDAILTWALEKLPPKYKTAVGVLGECATLAAYRLGYIDTEWSVTLGLAFAALIGVGASGKAQKINTELAAVKEEMSRITGQ